MKSRPFSTRLPEGEDALDRLLARCPLPEPDSWFAARTMARCRTVERPVKREFKLMRLWPRFVLAGLAALFVGGLGLKQVHHSIKAASHHERNVQQAFEVMASLGNDSDSQWRDSSL